jgi:hypothetical protein
VTDCSFQVFTHKATRHDPPGPEVVDIGPPLERCCVLGLTNWFGFEDKTSMSKPKERTEPMEECDSSIPHGAGFTDSFDRKYCGAKTRPGAKYSTCHKPAGWGTPFAAGTKANGHTRPNGVGRCRLHGGASRITHGQRSNRTCPLAKLLSNPDGWRDDIARRAARIRHRPHKDDDEKLIRRLRIDPIRF